MMRYRKKTEVTCKDCQKQYLKRVDTLKNWNGLCKSCFCKINKLGKIYIPLKVCGCGKICSHGYLRCRDCGAPKLENHYKWIKDRTQLKDDSKERGGQLHREWSRNVKNRDGWKCKISNNTCSGHLEAHHILGWKEYPELRYEINNGITLCHAHHPRKRAEEKRLSPFFQELINTTS